MSPGGGPMVGCHQRQKPWVCQGHWCRVGWDANHAELDPGRAQGLVGGGRMGCLERFLEDGRA